MEAVRPAEDRSSVTETQDPLPPPPAPFPVELLGTRTLTSEASTSNDMQQAGKLRPDLEAIQQCCIAALSGLIPYESTATAVLSPHDQQLAAALTDLLETTYDLEQLLDIVSAPPASHLDQSTPEDSFDALAKVLEQVSDREVPDSVRRESDIHPAIDIVREELAWNRVDALGTAVQSLARERAARREANHFHGEPPRYSFDGRSSGSSTQAPPSYDNHTATRSTLGQHKDRDEGTTDVPPSALQDKMMMELDAMAAAIERLHGVSPRLHNQRSIGDQGSARVRNGINGDIPKTAGPRIEKAKMRELEEIWDKIERAHRGRRALEEQRSGMDVVAASRRRRVSLLEKPRLTRRGQISCTSCMTGRTLVGWMIRMVCRRSKSTSN